MNKYFYGKQLLFNEKLEERAFVVAWEQINKNITEINILVMPKITINHWEKIKTQKK